MARKKKNNIKVILLVFITWFFILLPAFRTVFDNKKNRGNEFTSFNETEVDLKFIIEKEKALYPDQFQQVESVWNTSDEQWFVNWHVFTPYVTESVYELENLVITVDNPGAKKKKNSAILPEIYWARVYESLAVPNYDRIENFARAFFWFKENNNLSDRELLELIIDYIQQIPYELPENTYGLYTPPEIVSLNAGDCDSKSIFAALLLNRLGYDSAIFYSSEYLHAMLGINVSSMGYYKEMNGKNYYFTEMTAEGWQIGELPADCPDTDFWFISSI